LLAFPPKVGPPLTPPGHQAGMGSFSVKFKAVCVKAPGNLCRNSVKQPSIELSPSPINEKNVSRPMEPSFLFLGWFVSGCGEVGQLLGIPPMVAPPPTGAFDGVIDGFITLGRFFYFFPVLLDFSRLCADRLVLTENETSVFFFFPPGHRSPAMPFHSDLDRDIVPVSLF